MTFRVCSIGCGSMAAHVHGPSYRKYAALHSDVVLAACCDLDGTKAEKFMNVFGFRRYYTDMKVMLDTERPDAVCLVVPEHLTAQISGKIMEQGYPVLMEKPPGLNREETLRMIQTADRYNVSTQVAFNRRYMPLVQELKEILTKQFSPTGIQHIHYDFYRVGRLDTDFSATAIHGIDTVKFLAGSDYAHIRFHYQSIPGCSPEVVNITLDCEFESGTKAELSFFPVSGVLLERATVHLHNHTFFLNLPVGNSIDYPGRLMHYHTGKLILDKSGAELSDEAELFTTSGFYHENFLFFEDIRAGRKPAGDLRSALQSVEIADCIRNRKVEYSK